MTSPTSGYTSATSSTSSISGLISGMDTSSVIAQLMQIEAAPQNLLKAQLTSAQTDAAAYRDINTSFSALASASAALDQASTWGAAKASSSDGSVSATASSGAAAGTFSFTVTQLAAAHQIKAGTTWTNATDAFGLGSTLTVQRADGSPPTSIDITSSTTGPASLNDAVAAINKSGAGLSAAAIKTTSGYVLQISSTSTGADNAFTITSDTDQTGTNFSTVITQGADAQISIPNPGGTAYTSDSATNTFSDVLPGVTFTVSAVNTSPTTITVATDPGAVANAVQSVVDAANAVLTKIGQYTDSSTGSTAPLKGDWSLISLAGRILDTVSAGFGGASAASAGIQLTKDGQFTFDASAFTSAFTANPTQVQSMLGGATGVGADNVPGTADDTVVTDGLGARLAVLASQASDSANGILTTLAEGQDSRVTDLQSQIDDWTQRLQQRQQTLTDQFNAMETSLGTIKSQSSWLTAQINALPSWSSSSKN